MVLFEKKKNPFSALTETNHVLAYLSMPYGRIIHGGLFSFQMNDEHKLSFLPQLVFIIYLFKQYLKRVTQFS